MALDQGRFWGWQLVAKRGTLEHPKTKRLARALGLPSWAALGLLEAVWHWAGRYALTGALSIDDMEDCADTIRFDGGGDALAQALHTAGWLEETETGWYIHDWHDHADDAVRKALAKRGERFANGSAIRRQTQTNDGETDSRTIREQIANDSRLPEPEPEPSRDSSLRSESCPAIVENSEVVVATSPPDQSSNWLDAACAQVTDHLNQVCGKRYDPKRPHKNLRARLKEFKVPERDVGLRVCRLVIEHKFAEWGKDPRMRGFLRPETLFRASHWQSYTQAAMEWDEAGRPSLDRTSAKRGGKPEDWLAMAGGAA
jgi:uncharacterized phage protein (TIGR02220 family)